ncbi:MAG: phosphoglycerate dehydrogenase [Thermoguttaceae bacterium]
MKRIVLLDPISEDGIAMLRSAGFEYEERTGLKGDALKATLAEFDGAICRSGVKITADALAGNTRLKAIARAGVGVDNIDTAAATQNGIIVMNTPGGNTASTAELTFALLLALSRNICPAYQSLVEGRWDRKTLTGTQVAGKTLGVVGMGRIGAAVARYAKTFEMKVVALDPFFTAEKAHAIGVTLVDSFDAMLPTIDYLTVHTPLTDQTRGMFGAKQLEICKQGLRVINVARGGIYDEVALVAGLKSGKLGGVALDVYTEEPCTNNPLFGMPNVVCTPHLGASTEEAQSNVAIEAVELIIDYIKNGTIRQAVNFTSLDPETLTDIRGYLNVAYRLGMLSGLLVPATPQVCKLTYRGEVGEKPTTLISSAFAAGLLTAAMDQEVSIVSALPCFKERGIKIVEEKSSDVIDFQSLLTAELTTDAGVFSITGTLFGRAMPRLVQMNNFRLESFLDGNLLFFDHRDVSGVIEKVGGTFAKYGINIAHMALGRCAATPGGEALGILQLDAVPPQVALDDLLKVPSITAVKTATLPAATYRPAWM